MKILPFRQCQASKCFKVMNSYLMGGGLNSVAAKFCYLLSFQLVDYQKLTSLWDLKYRVDMEGVSFFLCIPQGTYLI